MVAPRRRSLGPIVRPLVVLVVMLILAWIFYGSVLMTGALVIGLVALAFLIVEIFTRLPNGRNRN